jgi:hypothetical protein
MYKNGKINLHVIDLRCLHKLETQQKYVSCGLNNQTSIQSSQRKNDRVGQVTDYLRL